MKHVRAEVVEEKEEEEVEEEAADAHSPVRAVGAAVCIHRLLLESI